MHASRKEPALLRARRAWKDEASEVYRTAIKRHGTCSAWLKDQGGRPTRGGKAADQIARLVAEMVDAGYSLDTIDQMLIALTRRITRAVLPDRPAA